MRLSTAFPHPKVTKIDFHQYLLVDSITINITYKLLGALQPNTQVTKILSIFQLKIYQIAALKLVSYLLHSSNISWPQRQKQPCHVIHLVPGVNTGKMRGFPKIKFHIKNYEKNHQLLGGGGFNHQLISLLCPPIFSYVHAIMFTITIPPTTLLEGTRTKKIK